jgi:hypothetical protein
VQLRHTHRTGPPCRSPNSLPLAPASSRVPIVAAPTDNPALPQIAHGLGRPVTAATNSDIRRHRGPRSKTAVDDGRDNLCTTSGYGVQRLWTSLWIWPVQARQAPAEQQVRCARAVDEKKSGIASSPAMRDGRRPWGRRPSLG